MKMINATGYSYDAMNNTLTCSASFLKNASALNSPEYLIIKKLNEDNANMSIVLAARKSSDRSAFNITFRKMEDYIKLCNNSADRLAAFSKVKSISKIQSSPYHYVKTWFLENYANYSEQPEFDEDGFVIVKTREEMKADSEVKDDAASDNNSASDHWEPQLKIAV